MSKNWKTRLIHPDAQAPAGYRSLATPTYRGSTVLFSNAGAVQHNWDQHAVGHWSAGIYFDAFAHGVDVTMQALTKYVGGRAAIGARIVRLNIGLEDPEDLRADLARALEAMIP